MSVVGNPVRLSTNTLMSCSSAGICLLKAPHGARLRFGYAEQDAASPSQTGKNAAVADEIGAVAVGFYE